MEIASTNSAPLVRSLLLQSLSVHRIGVFEKDYDVWQKSFDEKLLLHQGLKSFRQNGALYEITSAPNFLRPRFKVFECSRLRGLARLPLLQELELNVGMFRGGTAVINSFNTKEHTTIKNYRLGANIKSITWIAQCAALKFLTLRGLKATTAADEEFLRTLPQKLKVLEQFKLFGTIKLPIAIHQRLGLPRYPEKRLSAMRPSHRPLENYCKRGMDVREWECLAHRYAPDIGVALLKAKAMSRWRDLVVNETDRENLKLDFAEFYISWSEVWPI